jgi:ABC-type sulfate/molybdate transport systems ATPase subunit
MHIIEQELLRLRDAGVCIVMVTHNVLQAKRLADKVVVLHEGRTIPHDDPLAVSMLTGEWAAHS